MWVSPGAKSSRAFSAKLGIDTDENFAALLVRDVETGDDNGRLVPQKVKKAWQRWCLKGHPDRGGENDAYMAMHQEYEHFKEWFPERFNNEKRERVQQKERAADAEKAAMKARADSRLEEAKESATQAIAAYRALHDWYTQELKPALMQQAAIDLKRAKELLGVICQEAEEAENDRREKQEHRDLTSGLNSFLNYVCGLVSDPLAIPQKFDKLRAFFDESKTEIARMEADLSKKDGKMQKMLIEIEVMAGQLCDANHERDELLTSLEERSNEVRKLQDERVESQVQWDEVMQEASPDNTHWAKAAMDFAKGSMGLGISSSSKSSKSAILTANIKAKNLQVKQLKYENVQLKEESIQLHTRLDEMQSNLEVSKKVADAVQKKQQNRFYQMETDFDELHRTANLKEIQCTKHVEKLQSEATQSAQQIQELDDQIKQLQKQYNSICMQEVIGLTRQTQLDEQVARQEKKSESYIAEVNHEADLQGHELEVVKSCGPDHDPPVYRETDTKVRQRPRYVRTCIIFNNYIRTHLKRLPRFHNFSRFLLIEFCTCVCFLT